MTSHDINPYADCTPAPLRDTDRRVTSHEGWDLFETGGTDGHPWLELQRCDEDAVFDDDWEAHRFVWDAAEQGSRPHQRLLVFLAVHSPDEMTNICRNNDQDVSRRRGPHFGVEYRRPFTPDEKTPTGTRCTVKRSCDRCGQLFGDLTDTEALRLVDGDTTPPAGDECPICVPDPNGLLGHGIQPGDQHVFWSTAQTPGEPGYPERNGESVTVIARLDASDDWETEHVGPGWRVQFNDGLIALVFEDEITNGAHSLWPTWKDTP